MIKSRYCTVESLKIMGNASKEVIGPNIELLLWNVFKCKKKDWERDFVSLVCDKNLVLLQEAILNSPFDALFQQSQQHQWIMARSFRNVRTNIETGVKTGSTVAATEHKFSVSLHGEPFTKTKKMLLATEYPLFNRGISKREKSLLVINFHLINFVSFDKFKAHLDQVLHILENHQGPIILAGDFNTWNGKRLNYFKALTHSFSLEEVELSRRPKLGHLFQHLDHIYCRGLEVIDVKVHTEIRSSDHYPISLSLQLQPER